MNKEEQYKNFIKRIESFIEDYKKGENVYYIRDDFHYITHNGSLDNKLVVIQNSPERGEHYWATKEETHTDYVGRGHDAMIFNEAAINAGFYKRKEQSPFTYLNAVPFIKNGYGKYSKETLIKFRWMIDTMLSIIKPVGVFILGYDIMTALYPQIKYNPLIDEITGSEVFVIDNQQVIVPFQPGGFYGIPKAAMTNAYMYIQEIIKENSRRAG